LTGKPVSFVYGGKAPVPPVLPDPLPKGTRGAATFFTARSTGAGAITYDVLARPLDYQGLTVVVAIPLTSIRGYAEIFDLGAREHPEDLATAMHRIREEAERMNVMVDDLLLLARLDRERPLDLNVIDLVPVVARAVTAVRAVAPTHPVSLVAPAEVIVPGDSQRLRQVVDNLLVNAVRHSPAGGSVEVWVGIDGGDVVLEVGDHGPGVPEEYEERIFEPFFRADFSRARTTGGAGLGLAIVAAIVRAHGGGVGVRPNGADGARFWVRIPIRTMAWGGVAGPGSPAGHTSLSHSLDG